MWLFEGPVGCEPEFPKDFVGDREGEVLNGPAIKVNLSAP